MQLLPFILNLLWTILGLLLSILSLPSKVELKVKPLAIIFRVRSFWWYSWLTSKKNIRAVTNGHVVQLGPLERPKDLEHELVHVEQAIREPFGIQVFNVLFQ
jgi:prepilin signal peptidase PulO-like enzyme (type II secretory pathway)